MIIVRHREIVTLRRGSWLFVYGRRKTGKTFLVENFLEYDEFFFVKRDRTILLKDEWREFDYATFVEVLRRDLAAGKTVVVDEFHRLGDDFMDLLHALPKKGRLVVVSSTLHTAKMLVDKSSPLLGRFTELNVGIISLGDAMSALKKGTGTAKEMAEKAMFMREPITIDLLETGSIPELIGGFSLTIPALLGEIFSEEDRKMTKTYEGVIRAVAVGKCASGEISSFLYSRRLIEKDDPSSIQQYLNNLVGLGILGRTPVWGKKRFVYSHTSPLTRTYYCLDERYGIGDRRVSEEEGRTFMKEMLPRLAEASIREMMAKLFGMNLFLHEAPDFEVDGILARFKKPEIAFEIKWKAKVDGSDVKRAETNLERIDAKRRILIVPDKKGLISKKMDIMDMHDLLEMYEEATPAIALS